jgi:steroid 5-alpha reductase family enzyme
MSLWYGVGVVKKRNDVADVAWGLGFVMISWISFGLGQKSTAGIVVGGLVTVWGMRLASHILIRNSKKAEDERYQKWRREWGWFLLRSYFQVFVLQGVLMYLIALPIVHINSQGGVGEWWRWVGVVVWGLGFGWEAVADWQLAKFVSDVNNKGKIMQTGLWKYSRHPNYFGEVVLWWGVFILAWGGSGGWTVVGPLTISTLILFVSGVPLLEKKYAGRPEYEEYKSRTSVFIPWIPGKS